MTSLALSPGTPTYTLVVWPFSLGLFVLFFVSKLLFARHFAVAERATIVSGTMSFVCAVAVWLLTCLVCITLPKNSEPTLGGMGILPTLLGMTASGPQDIPTILYLCSPGWFFACVTLDATFARPLVDPTEEDRVLRWAWLNNLLSFAVVLAGIIGLKLALMPKIDPS